MKNIAIFTSEGGVRGLETARIFNAGTQFRVSLLVTDSPVATALQSYTAAGIPSAIFSPEEFSADSEGLIEALRAEEIDIILIDDFHSYLSSELNEVFGERIIPLDAEHGARYVADRCRDIESNTTSPEIAHLSEMTEMPEMPVSDNVSDAVSDNGNRRLDVEQQWADALGMKYDREQAARTTPPPMPEPETEGAESTRQAAWESQQQGPQQGPQKGPSMQQPPFGTPFSQRFAPRQDSKNENRPMPPTYMVWSILATLFCCLPLGVVAIVYSSQISTKYYMGDYEGARRASRTVQMWIIASIVVGVVTNAIQIPLMML